MADTPIKRALVSVTDKTGVVDFVKALEDEFVRATKRRTEFNKEL